MKTPFNEALPEFVDFDHAAFERLPRNAQAAKLVEHYCNLTIANDHFLTRAEQMPDDQLSLDLLYAMREKTLELQRGIVCNLESMAELLPVAEFLIEQHDRILELLRGAEPALEALLDPAAGEVTLPGEDWARLPAHRAQLTGPKRTLEMAGWQFAMIAGGARLCGWNAPADWFETLEDGRLRLILGPARFVTAEQARELSQSIGRLFESVGSGHFLAPGHETLAGFVADCGGFIMRLALTPGS